MKHFSLAKDNLLGKLDDDAIKQTLITMRTNHIIAYHVCIHRKQ